jgi:hypothetical protein
VIRAESGESDLRKASHDMNTLAPPPQQKLWHFMLSPSAQNDIELVTKRYMKLHKVYLNHCC